MRQINFSAGPAALPLSVLKQLQDSILEYDGSGVGICELGHRTKLFESIILEAKSLIVELLGISGNYEVLFMTGGGTAQFSAVPLNFIKEGQVGGYVVSGHWAKAAFEEASRISNAISLGSSEDIGYRKLPTIGTLPSNLSYLHYTSNNTIYGTQRQDCPKAKDVPIVCDMSSDFLSRPFDISKYALVYAAAQKLLGITGVTVVVVNKDQLPDLPVQLPKVLDYKAYIASNSRYNTPPVVSIFSVLLMLRWIKAEGGLMAMDRRNTAKAKLLYDFLDKSSLFIPYVEKANEHDRSKMNVVFNLKDSTKESRLFETLKKQGIMGTEGYRTVGGCRVSLYNPVEISDVEALVVALENFERVI